VSIAAAFNPLVQIHTKGDGAPFFCVHGAGGGVLNFRDLAQHLEGRPFYGLQARGINGQFDPHTSIEDMAAEYVTSIRKQFPNGPYLLGGYSGGGVIAFEMTHQLMRAGHQVALLAMIDTFCPVLDTFNSPQPTTMRRVSRMIGGGLQSLVRWTKRRWKHESWRLRGWLVPFYEAFDLTMPFNLREVQLTAAFHRAADEYRLLPLPERITILTAQDREPGLTHLSDDLGWSRWAEDVDVKIVSGNHDNLVLEPHVKELADGLGQAIDASDALSPCL
jgi:thioesterase domain-containing protein